MPLFSVGSLIAQGPPGSRVILRGGRLTVLDGGPRVTGATLENEGVVEGH